MDDEYAVDDLFTEPARPAASFSDQRFSTSARGPRRTPTEREADYAEIALLDRRGLSQQAIADRLGLSRQQVGFDLQRIRRRYVETANIHAGEKIGELLAGYRDVRAEAWGRWERTGDPRHLWLVLSTYDHERKLLGLDKLSAADFLTVESVMALANAIMSAIGRRVADPELVQQMKMDVLAMLPRSVTAEPPAVDAGPAAVADCEAIAVEKDTVEPADAAADPPTADEPTPSHNGVHSGDLFKFEPV